MKHFNYNRVVSIRLTPIDVYTRRLLTLTMTPTPDFY